MGKRKDSGPAIAVGQHKRPRQQAEESDEDAQEENTQSQNHFDSNGSSHSSTGEVGIIESISLKNFMCHSMLGPFQFGPNVNFVVGNNGSGKSAVLTALIVGLGGKATTTNRGSSLKGFVKDGQTSADVSITLRNRGEDAFRPEVYGDSIIVQQHITVEGNRSYKLKSKTGSIISAKKEELIAVLDHFNIQVDNPVSVLTQEMSKHFLQSKNEGDKYKRLHELRRRCLEKEERFKNIASLGEMKTKLEDLTNKMAWAMVNEMEKSVKPIADHISAEEARTVKYDQKIEEWQGKVNEAEDKFKAIQDQLEKISEEAQALKPLGISLKADVQRSKSVYNEAEVLYNRHRSELKRLERDDEQLRRRIEELRKSVDQFSEPEKIERLRKISQLKEQQKNLHDQEVTTGEQMDQFQQAIYKYKEEHSRLRREEHDVKVTLDKQKRQLRELKDSKTDRLKRFGEHMPDLLAAIDETYKQGRFTKKPVGPLVGPHKKMVLVRPQEPLMETSLLV